MGGSPAEMRFKPWKKTVFYREKWWLKHENRGVPQNSCFDHQAFGVEQTTVGIKTNLDNNGGSQNGSFRISWEAPKNILLYKKNGS